MPEGADPVFPAGTRGRKPTRSGFSPFLGPAEIVLSDSPQGFHLLMTYITFKIFTIRDRHKLKGCLSPSTANKTLSTATQYFINLA